MTAMPATIGVFRIERELGRGGMGVVYLARDMRLERAVAIKALPDHVAADPDRLARFEREARLLASLNHPGIAAIYSLEESGGKRMLVMEYVEGATLADRLARGRVPVDEALHIAAQIAAALEAAHEKGVIHRDLKPGNIMVTPEGLVKVLDFGLARSAEGDPSGVFMRASPDSPTVTMPTPQPSPTMPGVILGTVGYMSPEQARGKPVDKRSDIWSFGCVLYEMLAGGAPFSGESVTDVLGATLHLEPDWERFPASVPPMVRLLLRRCLTKDRNKRLRDIGDARIEIDSAIGDPTGKSFGLPAAGRDERRSATRFAPWLVAVVCLAAAVGLAARAFRAAPPAPRIIRAYVPEPDGATFVSIGTGPGSSGPVAVSPDGTRITFVARTDSGAELLFVRPLDALAARPVSGTDGARHPFWSHDSATIGFFADGKMKRIDANDGPAIALCEASEPRGGTWNRDGVIVFAPESDGPLFRVAATGSQPEPVTVLREDEETQRWPFFLPDGTHFLYFSRAAGGVSSSAKNYVMLGSLDGKTSRPLVQVSSNAVYASGHVLFVREGAIMAQPFDEEQLEFTGAAFPIEGQVLFDAAYTHAIFSASQNGVLVFQGGSAGLGSELAWFDREGKELGALGDPALYRQFRLSPDGRHIAASINDVKSGQSNLWIIDAASGFRTRFTFVTAWDDNPVWSPKGDRVVFYSDRAGREDLYQKSLGGTENEERILSIDSRVNSQDWTSDGRWIAYSAVPHGQGKTDLFAFDPSGGGQPVPIAVTAFDEHSAQFSPDGRWVLYHSDETGQQEAYVTPFPGTGRKWQVSTSGGFVARWGRDGKEIFYAGPERMLFAVDVAAQESMLRIGPPKRLFLLPPGGGGGTGFEVAGDSQRFLVKRGVKQLSASALTVVINWAEGLGRR